jgi:hypothetical protein
MVKGFFVEGIEQPTETIGFNLDQALRTPYVLNAFFSSGEAFPSKKK